MNTCSEQVRVTLIGKLNFKDIVINPRLFDWFQFQRFPSMSGGKNAELSTKSSEISRIKHNQFRTSLFSIFNSAAKFSLLLFSRNNSLLGLSCQLLQFSNSLLDRCSTFSILINKRDLRSGSLFFD